MWTAAKPSFTRQCLLQPAGEEEPKTQCSEGTSTQAEQSNKKSVSVCLISDLALNFFTFRDPEIPPSCKNGQRGTEAVWSHRVPSAELSGVSVRGLG